MRGNLVSTCASAFVIIAAACSKTPTFVDDTVGVGGGGGGTGGTGATSSTSSVSTSSSASGTTSTSSSSSASSASSSGSSSSSSSASSSGAATDDCWSLGANAWSVFAQLDTGSLGNGPGEPMQVSPDGLSITYVALDSGVLRPFIATRVNRALPFSNPQVVPGWGAGQPDVLGTWMVFEGKEMVVTRSVSAKETLFLSVANLGGWAPPAALDASINVPGYTTRRPTVSKDGALGFYAQDDGMYSGVLGRSLFRLHMMNRSAPVTPGNSFFANGVLAFYPSEDNTCPVLSPDGKFLFFASSHPNVVNGKSAALNVQLSTNTGSSWTSPVALPTFVDPSEQTCPVSVTADGCELYFRRFPLPGQVGPTTIWVAKRSP